MAIPDYQPIIQTKRWQTPVGCPEIQKFAGALQGNRAKKGILITTLAFTCDAQDIIGIVGFLEIPALWARASGYKRIGVFPDIITDVEISRNYRITC